MKKGKLSHFVISLFLVLFATGCTTRGNFIDKKMEQSENAMMYITARDSQEYADTVLNLILDCNSADELSRYRTKGSSNLSKTRCKEIIKALNGNIADEKCIYIDVKASENDERARYSIDAHYYLTVNEEPYVLSFNVIVVNEYEVFLHGLNTLQIVKYSDYKPDNHRADYVLPTEVSDRAVMIFQQPVYSKHHEQYLSDGILEHAQYDGRLLMEELLYQIEVNDEVAIKNMYAAANVNGSEKVEKLYKDQVSMLLEKLGGKKPLEAVGGIVDFYFFNLKPSYVDCDGIEFPIEYGMRYHIKTDEEEYKIQVVFVSSEDLTMPSEYVGVQSITFLE